MASEHAASARPHQGLGVFGGSFNPPHASHRRLCAAALAGLPIARLLVMPSGDHPLKRNQDMAPAADRLAMCRLAFGDLPGVAIDDREVRRPGPSFTVDTLAELRAEHPGAPLYLLVGSDNLRILGLWREPARILELATLVTYPRAGHPVDAATLATLPVPADARDRIAAHVLDLPADAVAASDLRARWRRGERDLPELTPAVRDYIAAHGLYA
ncbi:MAG: nicotinate (nicotinamide) nucleotide adenylyltransferase [Planctomycetota bacterium]|jgi:nicotinate-nucleotide adenylyltransferase